MDQPLAHGRRMLLAICFAVAVVSPIVIVTYPVPQIQGGWCQSGRPGHYTVETVARVALWSEILAIGAIALLVASFRKSWPGRLAVGVTCGMAGVAVIYVAWFLYAGRIDCAFN